MTPYEKLIAEKERRAAQGGDVRSRLIAERERRQGNKPLSLRDKVDGLAEAFTEGATFGLVGDEARAKVSEWMGRGSYDANLSQERAGEERMRADHPYMTMGAEVVGGLAPGAGLVGGVARGATLAGRMGLGLAGGAAGGAVYGAAEGEGGLGPRIQSAGQGAAIGGAVGVATPALGQLAQNAWRSGKSVIANRGANRALGQGLGVSPKGAKLARGVIGADDPVQMRAGLQRAGSSAMVADGGPTSRSALDAALQSPGDASRVAMDRIENRAEQSMGNMNRAMTVDEIGPVQGINAQTKSIRDSSATQRARAYEAAYGQEIDWRSPAGERLRQLLDTTPEEVKRAAARSRGMRVQPQDIPESAYPEMAPQTRTTGGPESWLAKEQEEIDGFFNQYNAARGTDIKRPLTRTIRNLGGVDPDSPAGRELKGMDLTSRNSPGLFRKGGLKDLDNLSPDMFPDTIRSRGDGTGFYMDRNAILEGIRDEMNGFAVRGADDMLDARAASELDRLLPEYEARQEALSARLGGPDAPDAVGDIVPMQTVEDIDMLKRQLDAIVDTNEGQGKLGGLTPYGLFAKDRAAAIRDALKEAAPNYGKALETAADPIRRRQAVEFGEQMLSRRTTTETALDEIKRATGGERSAMRSGLLADIQERLGNVRAVASDQNVNARQAKAAFAELSSPNAQKKMEALFGADWQGVKQSLDEAGAALGLRADIATNSRTFGRGMANDLIKDYTEVSALRRGKPFEAASEVASTFTGGSRAAVNEAGRKVRGELADVLTRPGQGPAILDMIEQANKRGTIDPQTGSALSMLLQSYLMGQSGRLDPRQALPLQ